MYKPHNKMNNLPKNILIIKASAGTGKTFSLVKEFLTHSLQNPKDYYHTLGLTFTKKATAEMKKRILDETRKIVEDPIHSKILNQIQNHFPYLTNHLAQKNAEELLSLILFEYSRLEFHTIDSFFYKIIKVFSKDLDIHPNFQIEDDTDLFVEQCVDELFKSSINDEELRNYLLDFLLYRLEESNNWNIDKPIHELAQEVLKDKSYDYIRLFQNKTFAHFQILKQNFFQQIDYFSKEYYHLLSQIESSIGDYKNNKDCWYGKSRGLPAKLEKIKDLQKLKYKEIEDFLNFLDGKKYFKEDNITFREITEKIHKIYFKLRKLFTEDQWRRFKTYYYAYNSLQTSALIFKLWEIGEKIKRENQFILMSDINVKIKEFIKNEPPEYLYWRMGNRYQHFMLDEFQDTSVIQYENLKPFIESVITTKPNSATALFVGDVKQSIYRWRGSQPSLLQNLHQDKSFQYYVCEETLTTNYRSAPEIVNFVNEFFDVISCIDFNPFLQLVQENFHDLNQKAYKNQDKGFIKIEKIEKKSSNNDLTEQANDQILKTIVELIQNSLKDCPEVTILVRTNQESQIIAKYLTANGISYTAAESLLMSNSVIIQFLFTTLKWIHFPNDPLNSITAINLAQNLNISIDAQKFIEFASDIKHFSLYEQTEYIIDFWELYPKITDECIQFLEFVHHYENTDYKKNLSFWDWFERYSKKQSLSLTSKERIQIMTIHQSKGLEFEVVICPFLDWELYPKTLTYYWGVYENVPYLLNYVKEQQYTNFMSSNSHINYSAFEKETIETILENTNILYVALTRAKKQLYGFFTVSKSNTDYFENIKTVADYFQYFFLYKGIDKIFELGTFTNNWNIPFHEKANIKMVENLNHYDWKNKILLKPIDEEDWSILISRNEAVKRGIIIHKVFEKLEYFTDLELILNDFIAQGKILPNEKIPILQKIQSLFENPLMKLWFSENIFVLKEQKFIQKNEEGKIPDRMVIHNNTLYIIDFKTGHKYIDEHQKQLSEYERLAQNSNLKAIQYFDTIKKYLVYIDENEIVEVV